MAMNKKEQAEMQALKDELRRARAWKRTDNVERDVMPPGSSCELSKGFDFRGVYIGCSPRVDVACSSAMFHAFGSDDKTNSQNSRRLFSTRLKALRAMRYAFECEAEKMLAEFDMMIEEQLAKGE